MVLVCSTGALPVKELAWKVEGPLTHTALALPSSTQQSPLLKSPAKSY